MDALHPARRAYQRREECLVDLFLPMFTLGLVTSLHCVSMCGPMVLTYALKGTEDASVARRVIPNVAYQGAKIASYMLVGLVLGAVGSAFNLDALRPYAMVLAGIFMIVLALGMTGRVAWAAKLQPRPPRFLVRALSGTRRKAVADAEAGHASLATPITFGLLTGLMPCAPLMAAQLNAAATGNAASGALAMLAFGLGTAPLMLGFGTASSLIPPRFKERVMVVLAIVVLLFGITYLNRGAMLLGSPVTLQAARTAILGGPQTDSATGQYAIGADGVAEVPLVIENVQFQPQVLDVPADTPVRLIVDRREDNACSDQLAIPQLGILVDLEPFATTVVELPPTKSGAYTLTCGMGMMSGQIRAGTAGVATGGDRSTLVILAALAGVVAAGAALAKTAETASDGQPRILGLRPHAVLLFAVGLGAAVLAGLALGGLL